MKIIRHRVNTVAELERLPRELGAELDLRSHGDELIMSHDPFRPGERFADYAAAWRRLGIRGPLVLNPKEDGIEARAAEILAAQGITDWFAVDVTVPAAARLLRAGFTHFAARYSEYENLDHALQFAGLVDWCWVDAFSGVVPSRDALRALRQRFRVCLVAPELHAFAPESFMSLRDEIDAVCTKFPELWG